MTKEEDVGGVKSRLLFNRTRKSKVEIMKRFVKGRDIDKNTTYRQRK